jgi:hypothetical protein
MIEDRNLSCEQRIKAVAEWSSLQTLRNYGAYGQALKLNIAYEDAIERYKELFNVPGNRVADR